MRPSDAVAGACVGAIEPAAAVAFLAAAAVVAVDAAVEVFPEAAAVAAGRVVEACPVAAERVVAVAADAVAVTWLAAVAAVWLAVAFEVSLALEGYLPACYGNNVSVHVSVLMEHTHNVRVIAHHVQMLVHVDLFYLILQDYLRQ